MSERLRDSKQSLEQLHAARYAYAAIKARSHLFNFAKFVAPSEYRWNWHHELLYHYLDDFAWGRRKRVIVEMPPGHGKPVYDGDMILLESGLRVVASDVQVGDRVITHLGRGRPVAAVHVQGDLPCVRVTTACGRSTIAATTHPFLTAGGWVKAGDLRPGVSLANVPRPTVAGSPQADEAFRLAGYFVGDGSTTFCGRRDARGRQSINAKVTCLDPTQRADIRGCAAALGFGIGKETDKDIPLIGGVRAWLSAIGLAGCGSRTKRVPEFVMHGSPDQVAHFVGAYFACDGCINRRGNTRRDACVEIYSVNAPLLRDVQHLLLRVGIQSRVAAKNSSHNVYANGPHTSYRLTITSQDDVAKFIDRVPLNSTKAKTLADWGVVRNSFDAPLLPDTVVSVESVGDMPCRCFTVEEDHTFTCDDMVVHNSEGCSRNLPAYLYGINPNNRVIACSYTADLASEMNRDVQRVMDSERYRAVFPHVSLGTENVRTLAGKPRRNSEVFDIPGYRGIYKSAGVGVGIGGRRFDRGIIDDPIKDREEANSPTRRESLWRWFTSVFMTRQAKDAGILITMCMTGDTPVLMADGTERPLRYIRIGDRIATYDNGKLDTSAVLNHRSNGPDFIYRIRTTCGIVVHANARHPFLVEDGGAHKWTRLKDLRLTQKIVVVKGSGASGRERPVSLKAATTPSVLADTADNITRRSGGQTGIGLHRSTLNLVAMHDLSAAMASPLLNTMPCMNRKGESAPFVRSLPEIMCELTGVGNCVWITAMTPTSFVPSSATTVTWPWVMPRHGQPHSPLPNTSSFTATQIESIEPAGVDEVFDIQVDRTENFIANGLVSHNTRWHEDDLVGRIKTKMASGDIEPYDVLTLPALATDNRHPDDPRQPGEPLWPWFRSKAELEQLRLTEPRDFAALQQQEPRAEGGTEWDASMFPASMWFDDWPSDRDFRRMFAITLDPSKGKNASHGDYSALIGGCRMKDGTIWIEADLDRRNVTRIVEDGIEFASRLTRELGMPLEGFGCESDQFQELLADQFMEKTKATGIMLPVYKMTTGGVSKEVRIRRLTPYITKGIFRFRATPGTRLLVKQLQQFPVGDHDDGPDALEYLIRLMVYLHNGRVSGKR